MRHTASGWIAGIRRLQAVKTQTPLPQKRHPQVKEIPMAAKNPTVGELINGALNTFLKEK